MLFAFVTHIFGRVLEAFVLIYGLLLKLGISCLLISVTIDNGFGLFSSFHVSYSYSKGMFPMLIYIHVNNSSIFRAEYDK